MAQTKTQNGKKYIKVGARWVDITGLNNDQIQQVVDGAKNGGSLNSRKIADSFRNENGPSFDSARLVCLTVSPAYAIILYEGFPTLLSRTL